MEIELTALIGLNWLNKSGVMFTKQLAHLVAVLFVKAKGIIAEISRKKLIV